MLVLNVSTRMKEVRFGRKPIITAGALRANHIQRSFQMRHNEFIACKEIKMLICPIGLPFQNDSFLSNAFTHVMAIN